METVFNVGDRVKINVTAYAGNGGAGAAHDEKLLSYAYNHPEETYTICCIASDCLFPYMLNHPVMGITSFDADELIPAE